ncbi:hypothetical protein FBY35_6021 [Streptomyces sp. SLBN-118]|uniref:hypothetical protein n=1 Tax=Streptomyces sp. SLBN-118 TaxID=2768454 RepID=UPI001167FB35|nr:hypothetical protein [Streptomyces sp. SLBN-118]TQK44512.1 hypothetical protein FBY35_6021 [Streptomyces sp. SLBN-118]
MKAASSTAPGGRLAAALESPFVGMSPWIVFSVLVGPGRFGLAVGLALGLSVAVFCAARRLYRGASLKILEVADVLFFAVLAVVGVASSPATHRWLETYAGEISNLMLVVIAFASMAVRVPFTMQYGRERVGPEYWKSPEFLHINYVITGVWGTAFLVAALAGGFGDLVLHNPDNLWTAWIIQIAAMVTAMSFTEWYPQVVQARTHGAGTPPPVRNLLTPLAALIIPVGVVSLIFDAAASWFGVGLILIGVILARAINKDVEMTPRGGEHPPRKRSPWRLR